MNKPIAISLLVSLFLWCVLHAIQETSGGVRGGRWSKVTFSPTRFSEQRSAEVTGESTADRRRAREAAREAERAAKEKEAAKKEADATLEAAPTEQVQETSPAK